MLSIVRPSGRLGGRVVVLVPWDLAQIRIGVLVRAGVHSMTLAGYKPASPRMM
jgi:hypothetical protein